MKILVFSDVHNSEKAVRSLKKKASKADLSICAGDFTNFETGMDKMLRLMNSFECPVLLVHGNHEDPAKVRLKCKSKKNIVFLHKKAYVHKGYVFVGHGGEGFALESKDFERFAKKLRFASNDKIVFVTHQPPYKTELDFIWDNHGNKSYRRFIVRQKPVFAVCGHLHETAGQEYVLGKTLIVNPGSKGMIKDV